MSFCSICAPVHQPSLSGKLLARFLALTILSTSAVPVAIRANVIPIAVEIRTETRAFADNGVGSQVPADVVGHTDYGLGDFSQSLRAYQEVDKPFPFGSGLAALAESKLSYAAHASAHEFSGVLNQELLTDVRLPTGASVSASSFVFLADFEVTSAVGFHALTAYTNSDSFGHHFSLSQRDVGTVLNSDDDPWNSLDLTGVLGPGFYSLAYVSQPSMGSHTLGDSLWKMGPSSFALTFDSSPGSTPTVPDAGSSLLLLGFGLAGAVATAKRLKLSRHTRA